MPARFRIRYAAVAFVLALAGGPGLALDTSGIVVTVTRDGDYVDLTVDLRIDATPQQVWDVLTDYDHMAQIVSNVVASRVTKRAGDRLEVATKSRTKYGPFDFKADNIRDVELAPPREIRSKIVSGDLQSSTFDTLIEAEGARTHVTQRGHIKPDRWIPPLVGPAMLESESRKRYAELRAEIVRRKTASTAAPAQP